MFFLKHFRLRHLLFVLPILGAALFFRMYRVTELPPAPYWEEAALSYDAYSILKTGRDHHGNFMPLVAFESFGDWKPSGYFYAVVPFVALFDLSILAVRLPSVLSGILIVVGVGVLGRTLQILDRKQSQPWPQNLGWWALLVTAISPWAIQFSRAGWEVNLATMMMLWGVIAGLRGVLESNRKPNVSLIWLLVSAILLIVSMYTYHSCRVLAPLLGIGIAVWWLWERQKTRSWKAIIYQMLLLLGISALMMWPLLKSLNSPQLNSRFTGTSIFSNLDIIKESNERKERAGNSIMARLIYHRYVLFGREIMLNYMAHFHPGFLFLTGDSNPRHSVQYVGTLYHVESIFLLLGLYYFIKHFSGSKAFLLWWLIAGLLPASLTTAVPHALRILPTLPVWMILIATGIGTLTQLLRQWVKPWLITSIIIAAYVLQVIYFWRFYTTVYPRRYAGEWQYGYQEMIAGVTQLQHQYPNQPVYITREQGRPAMYYWFYTQTDPRLVQTAQATAKKDQSEFLEFNNVTFGDPTQQLTSLPAIVATSAEQEADLVAKYPNTQIIDSIQDKNGQVIWQVMILQE